MFESVSKVRHLRSFILLVAFLAFFIDKLLITVIVPIVPNVLKETYRKNLGDNVICNKSEWLTSNESKDINQILIFYNNQTNLKDENLEETQPTTYGNKSRSSIRTDQPNCPNISLIYPDDGVELGLLFASKAIVQICVNPVVGTVVNKIGYGIPLFCGLIIISASTLTYAFGETYVAMILARAIQGIGSSCSSVGAMSMVADKYRDNEERGNAVGIVLNGLALGFLIGPAFGGFSYQLFGKEFPFIVIACLALLNGILQCFVLFPFDNKPTEKGPSVLKLFLDPYIVIIAVCLVIQNFSLAITEPTVPKWMDENLGSPVWQQGLIFLPSVLCYIFASKLCGLYGYRLGRWKIAIVGMILTGLCILPIPFSQSYLHIMACIAVMGLASGMVDATLLPQLGYIVDIRHVPVYGSVFAIADMSLAMGFCIGPSISGVIVDELGFQWLMWIFAILVFLYTPMLILIRNPKPKNQEKQPILNQKVKDIMTSQEGNLAVSSSRLPMDVKLFQQQPVYDK